MRSNRAYGMDASSLPIALSLFVLTAPAIPAAGASATGWNPPATRSGGCETSTSVLEGAFPLTKTGQCQWDGCYAGEYVTVSAHGLTGGTATASCGGVTVQCTYAPLGSCFKVSDTQVQSGAWIGLCTLAGVEASAGCSSY